VNIRLVGGFRSEAAHELFSIGRQSFYRPSFPSEDQAEETSCFGIS
jgi:hypothetical protein